MENIQSSAGGLDLFWATIDHDHRREQRCDCGTERKNLLHRHNGGTGKCPRVGCPMTSSHSSPHYTNWLQKTTTQRREQSVISLNAKPKKWRSKMKHSSSRTIRSTAAKPWHLVYVTNSSLRTLWCRCLYIIMTFESYGKVMAPFCPWEIGKGFSPGKVQQEWLYSALSWWEAASKFPHYRRHFSTILDRS